MTGEDEAVARWRDRCAGLPPLSASRVAAVAVILDRVQRRAHDRAERDTGDDPTGDRIGGERAG